MRDTRAIGAATGLLIIAGATQVMAQEPRIVLDEAVHTAQFSLSGSDTNHTQRFVFTASGAGELGFQVACKDQSEMTVTLKDADAADDPYEGKPHHFHKRSMETVDFDYDITQEEHNETRLWALEVASRWSMPVCMMSLRHQGRVGFFRWDGPRGPTASLGPLNEPCDHAPDAPVAFGPKAVAWLGSQQETLMDTPEDRLRLRG